MQASRQAGEQVSRQREAGRQPIRYLKVLYGVVRVNECFPDDLIAATLRGMEKEAMPSWKPSLLE